jgi:predicted Zn-dependent protease with MMP-like domain
MELRPDDPMPRICVARLELHDLGDPDAALDTVEAAFDFIDEEADLIEAIYLKAEALIARGEPAAARDALGELSTSVIDDAELAFDLAELALSADDVAGARRWVEAARKTSPDDPSMEADALHLIGRIHEANNDRDAMINAWQQVRKLDLAAPPGPLAITEDEVERITLATLAELPAKIREHLEKVPILIDDAPSEHIVAEGWDPRILGLFTGIPLPDDGHLATPSITNILLFRKNLERSCSDAQQLHDEIRITVLHETAHYFGLDDDDLEALGLD